MISNQKCDGVVTVRDSDSMEQVRMPISELGHSTEKQNLILKY